jgi:hypothetical protein
MGTWILVVESNCLDPEHEKEFNEWYNNTHIPDVVAAPNIVRATRYELTEPFDERFTPSDGTGKYLAIYEIESESDDIKVVMEKVGEFIKNNAKQGKGIVSPLFKVSARAIYKKTYFYNK